MSSDEPDRLSLGFPFTTVRQLPDDRFVVVVQVDEISGSMKAVSTRHEADTLAEFLLTNPRFFLNHVARETHK